MYHLSYSVEFHPDGISKEEILASGKGGCDAVVVLSLTYLPDGGFSQMIIPVDGRTGQQLSNDEQWKAWSTWAHTLMGKSDLSGWKRDLCAYVFEVVKKFVTS